MTSIQQIFVKHLLQCPPTGLDVIVVECDVWIVQVDPIGHAFCHLTPCAFVGPNTFSTCVVKGLHSELLDGLIAHQVKSLLHFDFNRKSVCIPSTFSFDKKTFHGLPSTYEILVCSCHNVMNTRFSVCSGWSFKENEWCTCPIRINGLLERLLVLPCF